MKRNILISFFFLAVILITTDSFGQRGRQANLQAGNRGQAQLCTEQLNLTQEQEAKVSELRTSHLETRLQYRNRMDELRVRKRTLQTQANPDMNELNQVIDQMSSLRGEMMKNSAAHRQEIRSILSDQQRVVFDSYRPARGREMQQGPKGRGRR